MITQDTLNRIMQPIVYRLHKLESQEPGAGILAPPLHAPTHEPGGTDPLIVDALATIGSLRTLGFGAEQAGPGNLSPTADQKAALVGTVGMPGVGNEYVTDDDPRLIPYVPPAPYVSPFYNVKDYGAIGNGSHNDFPEIQAAITDWQVTGGTLLFPQGDYFISSQLFLTAQSNKDYEIYGMGGATITVDNAMTNNGLLCDGVESSSLTIQNITIRRATVASAWTDGNGGLFIRPFVSGGVGFEGVWLQNVAVIGFGDEGIVITNCRRVAIMNCRSAQNFTSGLDIEGGSDIVILGGDYSYNAGNGTFDYGIAVASSSIYTGASSVLITGCNVNFNGRKGIDAHHGSYIRVIGNTCIGNGTVAVSSPSGIFVDGAASPAKIVFDAVIAYNVVDMAAGGGPPAGVPGFGIQAGIFTDQGTNTGSFIIHGNIISNSDNNTASGGILINTPPSGTGPRRVVISENSLYDYAGATGSGIHGVTSAVLADELIIIGNAFHAPGAVDKAINAVFSLNSIVTNNLMRFDAAANYGIQTTGGPGLIVNNVIVGTAPTIPYQNNVAAGSTCYGNRINGTVQFDPVCGSFENGLRASRGTATVVVPIGTRVGELTIAYSYTFAGTPQIICTMQDSTLLAAAEFPMSITVRAVTTTGCVLTVYLAAVAAATRNLPIGVIIMGV